MDLHVWFRLYLQHSFLLLMRNDEHSQMTSFLRFKVYYGSSRKAEEREREGERRERSIIFDFTVSVDVVYLGSSRALFSHEREHIPFSLLFSFSFYCSVLCFRRRSVSLRWEKKRNNFKLLFEHTSIVWPCSVLFPPPSSSSSPSCIPSTCRDDDREEEGPK